MVAGVVSIILRNIFWYTTQRLFERSAQINSFVLLMFLIGFRPRKCEKKL